MWTNIFSGELKYKYIHWLLKDLSLAEQYYLGVLRDGVDDTINNSINWVDDNSDDLKHLHTVHDWHEYYDDSNLESIWITLLNKNIEKSILPLYKYYRSGGDLAYKHMSAEPVFMNSDKQALDNLTNYVGKVVASINGELQDGIKKSIGTHIDENKLSDVNRDLITLNTKPLDTHFSIDNRCLFTAKTEYARSVNTGLLQAYSNYGVNNFDWVCSGLPNTCNVCLELEANSPYTLNEIMKHACPHPNCVCSFKARLPVKLELDKNPIVVNITPY